MIDSRHVLYAVDTGLITEAEGERMLTPPEPDPPAWSNEAQRLTQVIKSCASGAAAIEGVNVTIEEIPTGRTLPPPTGVPQ